MNYRPLGQTGFQVSEIGFGCAGIGGVFGDGNASPDDTIWVLQSARDSGINFFDTADMYAQGESERLLGYTFKKDRDSIIIATKVGYCLPTQRKWIAKIKPLVKPLINRLGIKRENLPSAVTGTLSQDFSADYIVKAVDASLRRLQTDFIDVLQLHSPPPDVILKGEAVEVLQRLKEQGKVRAFGIAADSVADAELALSTTPVETLMLPAGLLDQSGFDVSRAAAAKATVGVIARGCFGGGLLKPGISLSDLLTLTPKAPIIQEYRRLAREIDRDLLDIALHFVLRDLNISTTVIGMRNKEHLSYMLKYYAAPPLTDVQFQAFRRSNL